MHQFEDRQRAFGLGRLVSTPGALQRIPPNEMEEALSRHSRGDWGTVGQEDWEENELSLREGFRILSAYECSDGTKFWIITEADRSATTVLMPEEY